MQEVTGQQVTTCLKALGIVPGDGLLVHSAVQFLGRPVGGLKMYLVAIQEVIGSAGTLVVPTFNFGFARGESFDSQSTPSEGMGAFSEFVRQLPEAQRTTHPMQSSAAVGRYAPDLASRDTASAFDPGSAFERMLELDFKLLLLGADSRAVAMFHYCEQRAKVPYRYWKDFTGPVRTASGWQRLTYRMFARNLELNPQLTLDPVVEKLQSQGQWRTQLLNYGQVTACNLRDFVAVADQFLAENPWSMVTNLKAGPDGKRSQRQA
jgi:aminoglycoside 3-N-acetyltransferase